MYLTSMTTEELYAEVRKDLIEISTKENLFMDTDRMIQCRYEGVGF